MSYRIEKDTMGEVKVPADKYWGAQTERSRNNFKIGTEASMPLEVIYGFAYLKKSAAHANCDLGVLSVEKRDHISKAADDIIAGNLDDQFPLVIWQTGSGTQSNMNVNEVIANRAHVLAGNEIGQGEKTLAPNDDVNKSQSSNDTFPTGMHIACYKKLIENTIPGIEQLRDTLQAKSTEFKDVVKIGRTHLMDATPLTLGQEFSGYVSQLNHGLKALQNTLAHLSELALGGTAVGTGLNTPKGYDVLVAADGDKGLSLFRRFAPDTVLTDLIMPGKDGIRLIMEMKKINPDVRVIAMSGRWNNESGVNCIEAVEFLGADSTLRKPFSAKDLKAALMSALPKSAEMDCL